MSIDQDILGFTADNDAVVLYTMKAENGAYVKLLNIGATLVSVVVPDKDGNMRDVCLGFKRFETYIGDGAAIGKCVGRVANRIAKGKFTLEGKEYNLAINNGVNHLHGGPTGFQNRVWVSRVETDRVVFSYTSQDGEEGYPGELGCEIVYDFNDQCELEITFFAATDKTTVVNLTNHAYFNLNGEGSGTILNHKLKIYGSKYLPTDDTQIPTGEFADVHGTPMDFMTYKEVGKDINADFDALKIGNGYDSCWAKDGYSKGLMSPAADLYSPESGIVLQVSSTQPGVQIYTGNWLDGSGENKLGNQHKNREGIAIECQNFPDAPNKPNFPTPVLHKGETYEEHIIYKFSVKQN